MIKITIEWDSFKANSVSGVVTLYKGYDILRMKKVGSLRCTVDNTTIVLRPRAGESVLPSQYIHVEKDIKELARSWFSGYTHKTDITIWRGL
jgi:hypothetical protein